MRRKILSSAKGLTLVELLLTLSLLGVVSILIVGVLVSGMNSYKSVNKQISLHDEANIIMTNFSKEIFVATKVEPENGVLMCPEKIKLTKYNGDQVTLGFQQNPDGTVDAAIDNNPINSPLISISCNDPDEPRYTSFEVKENSVKIKLLIQDKGEPSKKFRMKEEVSFINVQQQKEGD